MSEYREPLHPRPQLARREWIDLRGVWGFAYDDDRRGLDECWQGQEAPFNRRIIVPFPPESAASGLGEPDFHPVVWYRRSFDAPTLSGGQRLLLHFGAVDYRAQVWVNGVQVAQHEGGHTPFSADITAALRPEGVQALVVRAEDEPRDLAQPRGKQGWHRQPDHIWYYRTTGIWQPVWLERVGACSIAALRWTPDLDRGLLNMSLALQRCDDGPLSVRVQLNLRGTHLVDDTCVLRGADLQRQFALDQAVMTMSIERLLWSPNYPNLLDATVTLLQGDRVLDEVQSYAGLRSTAIANGRFVLNGRPYFLRMALSQGYWPASHLAAPSDEALRREVELAKELGFNAVRIHQKIEDPRFLYWCDRLGLMAWEEMPSAYVFSTAAMQRLLHEWLNAITRDASHPCIVAWVPLNESWGVPNMARDVAQQHFVQTMYHLAKALDPTRPAIGNDGWEHLVGDIFGVHDYSFDGEVLRARYGSREALERTLQDVQPHHHAVLLPGYRREGEPIMVTEFGGLSYRPSNPNWFGYGTVSSPEEFLAKYKELVDALLDSPVIAGFCYTQLTDTEQETNGLVTAERVHKLDPAQVKAITRRSPASVPGDLMLQMQGVQGVTPFAGAALE